MRGAGVGAARHEAGEGRGRAEGEEKRHQDRGGGRAASRGSSGCTSREVLDLTGWPAVSMPAMAKACGVALRKEKTPGEPTRYFGS